MSDDTKLRMAVYRYRELPTAQNKENLHKAVEEHEAIYGKSNTTFIIRQANGLVDRSQKAIKEKQK